MRNRKQPLHSTAAPRELSEDELAAVSGGKASFSPLSVTKRIDKASTKLYTDCCTGAHFPIS